MKRNTLFTARAYLALLVLAALGAGAWWYFGESSAPPDKPPSMHARVAPARPRACATDARHVWSEFGHAEFAASFDEAFDAREKAFGCMATALGLSRDAPAAFLTATERDGIIARVKNGARLAALASRDARGTTVVRKDVVVAFLRSPLGKSFAAYAEEWTVAVGARRIVLARVYQCACSASAWAIVSVASLVPKPKTRVAPSPPRPRAPAPRAAAPAPQGKCFGFSLGFEGKPLAGYFWFDELAGKSAEEIEAFWQKLLASDCFKVNFAGGFSVKPSYGCDICRAGWRFKGWPPTLPAERHHRADIIVTIPGGNARIISFPLWAAVHHAAYCPEDHSQQGYVNPAITAAQISRGVWNYGSTVEPYIPNQ